VSSAHPGEGEPAAATGEPVSLRRLNWGCGEWVVPGWVNSDIKGGHGVVACDIRQGLPFEADEFDYVVSIHALPELSYNELVPAVAELRRVVKPGGTLRLALPDLEKSMDAYRRRDRDYFLIPDEVMSTLGGKLALHVVWYGYSRTVFVPEFIEELLLKAGFTDVHHVGYRETRSAYPEIVSLDNREAESLFVEAVK
jgi:SAM-dependent methyltransferase